MKLRVLIFGRVVSLTLTIKFTLSLLEFTSTILNLTVLYPILLQLNVVFEMDNDAIPQLSELKLSDMFAETLTLPNAPR